MTPKDIMKEIDKLPMKEVKEVREGLDEMLRKRAEIELQEAEERLNDLRAMAGKKRLPFRKAEGGKKPGPKPGTRKKKSEPELAGTGEGA